MSNRNNDRQIPIVQTVMGLGIGALFIALAIVGPIALGLWWIQSNWGADTAGAIALGGAVLIGVVLGWAMTQRTQKTTLENTSDFAHDLTSAYRNVAGVQREYARAEREQMAAHAKMQVLDAKRVDQLAQQRAALLARPTDQPAQPQPWQVEDQAEAAQFRYVE